MANAKDKFLHVKISEKDSKKLQKIQAHFDNEKNYAEIISFFIEGFKLTK